MTLVKERHPLHERRSWTALQVKHLAHLTSLLLTLANLKHSLQTATSLQSISSFLEIIPNYLANNKTKQKKKLD